MQKNTAYKDCTFNIFNNFYLNEILKFFKSKNGDLSGLIKFKATPHTFPPERFTESNDSARSAESCNKNTSVGKC